MVPLFVVEMFGFKLSVSLRNMLGGFFLFLYLVHLFFKRDGDSGIIVSFWGRFFDVLKNQSLLLYTILTSNQRKCVCCLPYMRICHCHSHLRTARTD
jgi:hypothetical protein